MWQGGGQNDHPGVTVEGERVFVATGPRYEGSGNFFVAAGKVTALDVTTGAQLWTFDTPSQPFPVASVGNLAIWGTSDGTVFAVDIGTGQLVWRHDFPGIPFQVLAYEGGLAVADGDPETWGPNGIADKTRLAGRVQALDPVSGSVLWEQQVGNFETFIAAAPGGLVAASAGYEGEDEVRFIEPDGTERWRAETGSVSSVRMVQGSMAVVAGSSLWSFALDDGRPLWSAAPTGGGTFTGAAVQGDVAVAATNTGSLQAFSLADGRPAGASTFPECGLTPLEGSDLFLSCGSIIQIVASGGSVTSSVLFTGQGATYSAAFAHGRVFFASNTGHCCPAVAQFLPGEK